MFKKLIVGIDFTQMSERAARTAIELGKGLAGEVVLVHVVSGSTEAAETGSIPADVIPGIERMLKELCARMATPGVKLDWGVVDGHAAAELSLFAERWSGDMIVVGTAAHSNVAQMLLGSVADRLLKIAKVPVLVVGPNAKS